MRNETFQRSLGCIAVSDNLFIISLSHRGGYVPRLYLTRFTWLCYSHCRYQKKGWLVAESGVAAPPCWIFWKFGSHCTESVATPNLNSAVVLSGCHVTHATQITSLVPVILSVTQNLYILQCSTILFAGYFISCI